MSITKAALINATAKYSRVIIYILTSIVLARLLSAEEYGIVAIETVFTNFFTIFCDMGIAAGIVQKKDLLSDDIKSIFSFSVLISFILMIIVGLCGYAVAYVYLEKAYIPIGWILAASLLFTSINTVPNALLLKSKEFGIIAFRTVVINLSVSCITIILAYNGMSYYTIAIQSLLTSVFSFLWNYSTNRIGFRLHDCIRSINKIANYSAYQMGFCTINYMSRNFDNLLIGKIMNATQLGYYNKSYELMCYPNTMLSGVITPVLHPVLSEYQTNKELIFQKYIRIIHILALGGILISGICILAANEIILIIFGSKWKESIPIFRILAVSTAFQMVTASTGAVYQSLNGTKILFKVGITNTLITLCAISVSIFSKNLIILSYAVTIAYILNFFVTYTVMMSKCFQKPISGFFMSLAREAIIYIILILSIVVYPFVLDNLWLSLLCKCIYILTIYCIMLVITGLMKSIAKEVKPFIHQALKALQNIKKQAYSKCK